MAGAVGFPGLVEPRGLVVGSVDAGQRRQYRGLVRAVSLLLEQPAGGLASQSGIELMLLLCAAYVFGCAFRSFLPRADVQRICLFDTWLSSVIVGRTVATVAEVCFAAQWAIILHQLGTMTGADTYQHRVGDRAADRDRRMLFMACGADHQLSVQRHREFDLGRRLLPDRHRAFAGCCRSSTARFAWSSPSRSSGSCAFSRSS